MAEKSLAALSKAFTQFKYNFNRLLSIYKITILSPEAMEFL